MTEPAARRGRRLRLGPLMRVLLPSLFTLILIVLLLFTMFFTAFDWQWVTFLGGILFASVLAMVSSTWKSGWRMARRTAEAAHFKQRLSAEIQQHRGTREQLERELGLHQQDRARLARETESHQRAAQGKFTAENMLAMLGLNLQEIAFYVDRSQHFRFHTRKFAAWTGVAPERIDGSAFEEVLLQRNVDALRPPLLDALDGRPGRTELSLAQRDGSEQRVAADCFPQHNTAKEVVGVLVLIREVHALAAAAPPHIEPAPGAPREGGLGAADETEHGATKLLIADVSGNAVYLSSLTEELSGWGNPRERILQAIRNDGFDLYAQDIVALGADAPLKTMRELLIRMRDEEQNMVPPGTFLPIAERFNMMPDIDRFVVRKAIAAHAAVGAATAPLLCINVARSTIEDRSFPEFVGRALEQSGTPGQALCFEIADSDAIACLAEAARFARELKPLGCRFTLDGFGSARIGFEHIKVLPLDFLKIDGSIILQILRVPEALAKVRAIQRVSKVIGVRTIAEMVESDECLERLRAAGVDYAQGFGIAKPRPFSQDAG
jgi:EAL domain-containing protein (putative c-di-GMP-specific phosphodiesterase class I)/PAS domain-containing protein